jgi:DNA repair exonuclease SbcCD ATPase subunit
MDYNKFKNPTIRVVWEDYGENFTQEKIKSVENYFKSKYKTNNVTVMKSTIVPNITNTPVDVSLNILDKNYQVELIKSYLKSRSLDDDMDEIIKLDKIVNDRLVSDNEPTPFKRWKINKIEFSNFLSFGENQFIDFNKYYGITSIESNPPNFGGKTVASTDLLLFLFFNETTKTTKAEEVFNIYTEKDKVYVKGDVTIDGDDYIIERSLVRKTGKSGDRSVKTELEFYKKHSDGSLQSLVGEQRRETESFIKNSIGTKEDFLMSILTTASNLEDLIESKPTARGAVLSRFMGLDFIKRKEEAAKEIYSEFSKSMISNLYNKDQIIRENADLNEKISISTKENIEYEKEVSDLNERILKGLEYKETLLKSKHTDIDREISQLNPDVVKGEINSFKIRKESVEKELKSLNLVEPSEFFNENEYDRIKEEYNQVYFYNVGIEQSIKSIEELKSSVDDGVKCSHCGIDLMSASITQSRISELDELYKKKEFNLNKLSELKDSEQKMVKLKKEFDEYEKNKLIKDKHEVTIESYSDKISNLEKNLDKYYLLQDKINENNKTESLIVKSGLKISELESSRDDVKRKISANEYFNQSSEDKIELNLDRIEKIENESKKERIYKLYLEIFGKNGITKLIMRTMMPMLNQELQKLLDTTAQFQLEIRINEKNEVEFIMIDNKTQIEKSITTGSGYEKTVSSLALRAVLSKVCALPKPDIIVMDEVFGKIANDNLDMVGDFFIKIKNYFDKIILITHNPLVSNWADNTIKISKENFISKILN